MLLGFWLSKASCGDAFIRRVGHYRKTWHLSRKALKDSTDFYFRVRGDAERLTSHLWGKDICNEKKSRGFVTP